MCLTFQILQSNFYTEVFATDDQLTTHCNSGFVVAGATAIASVGFSKLISFSLDSKMDDKSDDKITEAKHQWPTGCAWIRRLS